ncbi:MAG: hypothetical protein HY909_26465 [Deltaproteobacteria bacterium]|nr:hypothetical protein [Deltaproteobacteria bacterium]
MAGLVASLALACSGNRAPKPTPTEQVGPWGRLVSAVRTLEVPSGHVRAADCEVPPQRWTFRGATREGLAGLLGGVGLSPTVTEELVRGALCTTEACVVTPGAAVEGALSPEVRSALYARLARDPRNVPQALAFRRSAQHPERWAPLADLVGGATLDRLTWRQGQAVLFSDLDLLCARVTDPAARVRLVEVLSRSEATMAWLVLDERTDVGALVSWWGAWTTARELRPMLEDLARAPGGSRLDIANLLPPWARRRVNTFPRREDPPQNCMDSALRFFSPEDSGGAYLDPAAVGEVLARDYVQVPADRRRFGDVVVLCPPGGAPVHAVNHVAGTLVFSKDGAWFRRPWLLEPLAEVQALYPDATELRVYRRR